MRIKRFSNSKVISGVLVEHAKVGLGVFLEQTFEVLAHEFDELLPEPRTGEELHVRVEVEVRPSDHLEDEGWTVFTPGYRGPLADLACRNFHVWYRPDLKHGRPDYVHECKRCGAQGYVPGESTGGLVR